jgi:hypothetical protein
LWPGLYIWALFFCIYSFSSFFPINLIIQFNVRLLLISYIVFFNGLAYF